MREIRFRGRKICKNEWVYGYYIEDGLNNHYIVEIKDNKDKDYYYGKTYRYVEVIPETIGQFTGLYDKNNIPIYEGDIVEYVYVGEDGDKRDYKIKKGVMNFKNNGWHINSKWLDGFTMNMFQFEVIGNIYDNKEDI